MKDDWKLYARNPERAIGRNTIDLLIDGEKAFPAMLEAIAGAQHFISLETYIFQPDVIGTRFRDALTVAAVRGVEVRLIYDSIGAFETSETFWRPLAAAGGQLLEFHRVSEGRWEWAARLNRRDHRKVLVIDGQVGFCGGINIHDEELPESQGGASWRDVHVRITGPAVRELQRLFLQTWEYEKGPPPANIQKLLPQPPPAGEVFARIVATNALKHRRTIHRSYLHAIKRARRFIYLWNPYFIPDRGVRRAFKNAAKRGVDIRVIVPARNDIAAVRFASRNLYGSLMRHGVRIFEWREHVMHAKCGVIDGNWSTVGSFNLDHRSLIHNMELNAMIFGEPFGAQMVEMFELDMKSCAEVDAHSWPFRPLLDRILEKFFYLFRYWL